MRGSVKHAVRVIVCASIWLCMMPSALGQTAPATLYAEGKDLMNAGDFVGACRKLQESYDLEPKFGRLYTLALCRDREGRGATALELYHDYLTSIAELDAAARASHLKRAADAMERVRVLEAELPKLKLVWRGDLPKDVKVLVDGSDAVGRINTEWVMDPGEHGVAVERDGRTEELRTVSLKSGNPLETLDLTPVTIEKQLEHPVVNPNSPIGRPKKIGTMSETEVLVHHEPERIHSRQITLNPPWVIGVIGLSVGTAGITTGAVLGEIAIREKRRTDAHCTPSGVEFICSPAGRAAAEDTLRWGNWSTAVFALGTVVSITGFVFLSQSRNSRNRTIAEFALSKGTGTVFVKRYF